MSTLNERIKKLRKGLDLTQQEFADRLGTTRNNIAGYEVGRRSPSEAVISLICKTFNVNETWLRTGDGEMFLPSPSGALDELAKEYGLSNGAYILIQRFLALKPEEQQAFVDYAVKVAADFASGNVPAFAPAPTGQERTVADASGQERTEPDIAAELAELKRQNQELAAKVAAMEEEDALLGPMDASEVSPSVSDGIFSPNVKK